MDIETVRAILCDLDLEKYHFASIQKPSGDEVWPAAVEDAFLSAVHVFASVGQRKYQIDEKLPNGSSTELVGRNDIISRYIFMKTNKYRARKQVSSHIQVWAHCKKPPSNRDMDMATFQDLQMVFRMYYSRPTTEFGQPKKKIRRVVSTSNALSDHQFAANDALGIYQTCTPLSEGDGLSHGRKHGSQDSVDYPAKRCRRVVSELPCSVQTPFLECTTDKTPLAALGPRMQPVWLGQLQGPPGLNTPTPADQLLAHHHHQSVLPAHPPVSVQAPMFLQPFDDAIHPGHGGCDSPSSMPNNPSVAAALTAAAMAAVAGFEDALSSPMLSSPRFLQGSAPGPHSFGPRIPSNTLPFNRGTAISASVNNISAFAAAAGSGCRSEELVHSSIGHPFGAEGSQAFTETIGKYYTDMCLGDAPAGCVPFYVWNKVSAEGYADGGVVAGSSVEGLLDPSLANKSASSIPEAAGAETPALPIAPEAATDRSRAPRAGPAPTQAAALADPMPHALHERSEMKTHTAASTTLAPGSAAANAAGCAEESPPCEASTTATIASAAASCRPIAGGTEATDNSTAAGTPAPYTAVAATPGIKCAGSAADSKHRKPGKHRQLAKEPRSSPSCTQSLQSGNKDCDTITVAHCSSPPAITFVAPHHAADDDGCRQAFSDASCSDNPVTNWLNSLGTMLEAQGISGTLYECQPSPTPNDAGEDWYSVIARYLQSTG
ncbi:hypothetical protein GQ54DRAFT_312994 [Martensiomyces pterosporus]|nr:hypothetical protein GQ54DRAFT_312994 [Martensiomyces pterosporus]